MTPEERAFLLAIAAEPGEDTPRLAYADWLDEQEPARAKCPKCKGEGIYRGLQERPHVPNFGWWKCEPCDGTGTTLDTSRRDRAEFIRSQIELAQLGPPHRELFVADGAGKQLLGLGVPLIPRGDGHYSASSAERGLSTETFTPGERLDIYAHLARNDRIGWLRGLKYVQHIPERQEIIFRKDSESGPWKGAELQTRSNELLNQHRTNWLRIPCKACNGTGGGVYGLEETEWHCETCQNGDAGGLTWRQPAPGTTHFSRGFPATVECRLKDVWNDDDATTWAKTVATHHPVIAFRITDREPWLLDATNCAWWSNAGGNNATLGYALFDALRGETRINATGGKVYPSREAAHAALAQTLAQLIRSEIKSTK